MRWIISAAALTVAGLTGAQYVATPANPQVTVTAYTGENLIAIRKFCNSYYEWRDAQPVRAGMPTLDRICFETQEMKP